MVEFVTAEPCEIEIVACADAELLSFPYREAVDHWLAAPELRPVVERLFAQEVMALRARLSMLAFSSLESKVVAFLLQAERVGARTPDFKLTQGMIAQAVGATRPKVNRCLKLLEYRGMVYLSRSSGVALRDREKLMRIA